MKKVIVGILLALVLSPAVYAEGNGAGGLGVFGSWWDSKDYDALYGGGVRLGFELFSGVALEARASYLVSEDQIEAVEDLELVPLEAALTWTLDVSEAIKPYVGAGAGYYLKNVNWDSDNVIEDAEENDSVGYFALAGANILLGNVALFAEAKYNVVQDDDEWRWQGDDVKQKNSLDGFAANVGIKFGL